MRFSKLAFVGTQFVCRRQQQQHSASQFKSILGQGDKVVFGSSSSTSSTTNLHQLQLTNIHNNRASTSTRLFSSSSNKNEVTLQNIDKSAMEEIIEDYEEGGREESGYLIMDVREEPEIAASGKLSPNTVTFPLQKLMQYNAFDLEEDEFEEIFGFDKPTPDETLVFSCAAGIRSVHAAQFAAQGGYTKLVNYMGGANEWFYS